MRRGVGLLLVLSLVLAAPLVAEAQQGRNLPRIGVLASSAGPGGLDDALFDGLRALGYVDRQNVILDIRWSAGEPEQYSALAAELIGLKVDVIVGSGARCQAAFALTKTIPIVCPNLTEPVERGLITSFARPGGNVTGLLLLTPELFHKRFQLLKEAVPRTGRVAFLWLPESPYLYEWSQSAARLVHLRIEASRVERPADIDAAFAAAMRSQLDAVVTAQGPLFSIHRKRIADLGLRHRLPVVSGETGFAAAGGLMEFGPDIAGNWRRAASYVDKVLKGAKAGDLPVEQPTIRLVINLKTAKALGLTIPPSLLLRADQVIE